jgi:hypothetical protein
MRQPAGVGFHPFELIRVHEKNELRARRHGRDGAAPAKRLRPEATVTHFTTHEAGYRRPRPWVDQRQNAPAPAEPRAAYEQ